MGYNGIINISKGKGGRVQMMTENHGIQLKLIDPKITIEDFVPQGHLLRKI